MGGALGRSMTESHEKMTFCNDASWKFYFSLKDKVLSPPFFEVYE
jgi:hypothetical protein